MRSLNISIILIIFLINSNVYSAKLENNILIKVENKIITKFELKNKIISTLILANEEINQTTIDKLKGQALDILIKYNLKKIEVEKYEIKSDFKKLNDYLQNISLNNIDGLKDKFSKYDLDFSLLEDEIDVQLRWQTLIYKIYSNKIEIDESIIDKEVEIFLKNKSSAKEFRLAEIELMINNDASDINLIKDLQNYIKDNGFENSALKFSTSSTATNKGDLGWVQADSLSTKIYEIVSKLETGQISEPIKMQNRILFLKLKDSRKSKNINFDRNKIKKNLINIKKNELFNLYSNSHLSKLKNTSLIEYIK